MILYAHRFCLPENLAVKPACRKVLFFFAVGSLKTGQELLVARSVGGALSCQRSTNETGKTGFPETLPVLSLSKRGQCDDQRGGDPRGILRRDHAFQ